MKKKSKSIAGIPRESAMLAAGYCTGLAFKDTPLLDKYDRKMLKIAGRALYALTKEHWPDWFS